MERVGSGVERVGSGLERVGSGVERCGVTLFTLGDQRLEIRKCDGLTDGHG